MIIMWLFIIDFMDDDDEWKPMGDDKEIDVDTEEEGDDDDEFDEVDSNDYEEDENDFDNYSDDGVDEEEEEDDDDDDEFDEEMVIEKPFGYGDEPQAALLDLDASQDSPHGVVDLEPISLGNILPLGSRRQIKHDFK